MDDEARRLLQRYARRQVINEQEQEQREAKRRRDMAYRIRQHRAWKSMSRWRRLWMLLLGKNFCDLDVGN